MLSTVIDPSTMPPEKIIRKNSQNKDSILWKNLNDDKLTEKMLKDGADPNYLVPDGWWKGWTPLAYAVYKKKLSLVKLLLNNGANANQFFPGTSRTLFDYSFDKIYDRGTFLISTEGRFIIESSYDYRIPFALVKHGAKIPLEDGEFIGPGYVYRVIRFLRINPYLNKDDNIINAIAKRTEFALKILEKHFEYASFTWFVSDHWGWQQTKKFIQSMPTIPKELADVTGKLIEKALGLKDWELAFELLEKGGKIAARELKDWELVSKSISKENKVSSGLNVVELKVTANSPLVDILKNTQSSDFLIESDYSHQNPTNCFKAILASGYNANETFEQDGKTWSLLSWAASKNNFVAVKLLLKYGANPQQLMPGTTRSVMDCFIEEYLNEIKITIEECAIQFLNFSVQNKESLKNGYIKWSKDLFKLWQEQARMEVEYNKLAMEKEENDEPLRFQLKKLLELKNNLIKNENFIDNPELHDYLLNNEEFNRRDKNGFFPLHFSCILNDLTLTKKLVEKGANKDILDVKCITKNKVYSIKKYMQQLEPDYYRLFATEKLIRKQGMDGIINYGLEAAKKIP